MNQVECRRRRRCAHRERQRERKRIRSIDVMRSRENIIFRNMVYNAKYICMYRSSNYRANVDLYFTTTMAMQGEYWLNKPSPMFDAVLAASSVTTQPFQKNLVVYVRTCDVAL